MGHDVGSQGGDQATWQDLVARLKQGSALDPVNPPWPDRESLAADIDPDNVNEPGATSDSSTSGKPGSGARTPASHGRVIKPARPAGTPAPADGRPADARRPKDARQSARGPGDLPDLRRAAAADGLFPIWNFGPLEMPPGECPAGGDDRQDGASCDPVWPDFEGQDEDDRYIPPHLPPLPKLDPIARGAWAALFGGPAYLFVATMLGWQVPGWAQLAAVIAFIAGFVVLVSRLGDGPSRRDGPDQGAVV